MSFNSILLNYSTSSVLYKTNNDNIDSDIEGNQYNGLKIFSVCFSIIISLFLLGILILLLKLFIIDEYCCRSKSNEKTKTETQDNIYEYI